ncbi:MAG: hypothetical protein JWM12_2214 [Ilumatobacteraceae bacterium]|nr:hypothetical protein [Ilumatobacteraceae bacterium]
MPDVAAPDQQLIASRRVTAKKGKLFGLRMAESFFRRWPLYVLPIILFIGLGVLQAKNVPKVYKSVGSVNVSSSTFLSDLTSVRTPDVGYETPATKTARDINERMTSDAFATSVADAAGLTTALSTGQITLAYVRSHVFAAPTGDTLLQVSSTTDDPTLSQRLATALISSYTQYVLSVEVAGSNTAAAFYTDRITKDQVALTKASNDLVQYLDAHPAPAIGNRTDVETIAIQGLQATATASQQTLNDDTAKLDTAQLAITSAESDIGQRLKVADQPLVASAPEPTKMKQVFALAIFALLGLVVVVVGLIVAALLDKAVRSSEDIGEATGLEVVATIPVRRKNSRSGRSASPELSGTA